MVIKKILMSSLVLAGSLSLPLAAHAAEPGLYFGAGLGQGNDLVLNQTSSAYKIFGGFNFNRYLGAEISYVNLGSNYIDINGNSFTQKGDSFDVIGYLPLSPYVDLFGRAGVFNWTVSDNYYYAYTQGTNNDYGFGIDAQINPQAWVRGEYQKFIDVAGGDVSMTSVSFIYHF